MKLDKVIVSTALCLIIPTSVIAMEPDVRIKKPDSIVVTKKVIQTPQVAVKTDIPKAWLDYLNKLAKEHKYDISLLQAIIEHESNWVPNKVSRTNDYGLAQINKSNLPYLKKKLSYKYKNFNIFNPYTNMDCMIVMLNDIRGTFERTYKRPIQNNELLISYNRGVRSAVRYISANRGGYTNRYYTSVMDKYKQYKVWNKYKEATK